MAAKMNCYPGKTTPEQQDHFAAIAAAGDLAGRSVLDIGCGLCCFKFWAEEQEIPLRHYTGVEGCEEIILAARRRRPQPDVRPLLWPPSSERDLILLWPLDYDIAIFVNFIHLFSIMACVEMLQCAVSVIKEKVICEWSGPPSSNINTFIDSENISHSLDSLVEQWRLICSDLGRIEAKTHEGIHTFSIVKEN